MPAEDLKIIRFSPDGPPGVGMAGDDDERMHTYYRGVRSDRITSGVWEASHLMTSYKTRYSEFIYLLDGSLTLIDGDDREETFHAGDTRRPRAPARQCRSPIRPSFAWIRTDRRAWG